MQKFESARLFPARDPWSEKLGPRSAPDGNFISYRGKIDLFDNSLIARTFFMHGPPCFRNIGCAPITSNYLLSCTWDSGHFTTSATPDRLGCYSLLLHANPPFTRKFRPKSNTPRLHYATKVGSSVGVGWEYGIALLTHESLAAMNILVAENVSSFGM